MYEKYEVVIDPHTAVAMKAGLENEKEESRLS